MKKNYLDNKIICEDESYQQSFNYQDKQIIDHNNIHR
jgi:hypothetical protein